VFGTLFALVVFAVLAFIAVFGSSQAVASAELGDADFGYVVVQPGGSLWDVASEVDPSVDPRDLVAEIVRLNNLEGSGVQAGQPIALPLRYADAEGAVSAEELGI
jgi:LysM repeat protein